MTGEDFFVMARALHVVGVVLWIGGVAFITMAVLPALRNMPEAENRLALFGAIEGRFRFQAKFITLLTSLSGFFMLTWLDGWDRYLDMSFWWVHLMTFIWVFFTLVLFVIEPILFRRNIHQQVARNPDAAFRVIHRMLKILLALSIIAIIGAVAGVHG